MATITLDIVKVVNTDDERTYKLKHKDHGTVDIAPGETAVVPLDVALTYFGNPGARNRSKKERFRDIEIQRIHRKWGYYPGYMPREHWEENCPRAEIYDLNDKRIWMIHDDPTGENATASAAEIERALDPEVALEALRQQQTEKLAAARAKESGAQTQVERNRLRDEIPEAPEGTEARTDKAPAPRTGPRRARKKAAGSDDSGDDGVEIG